MLRKMNSLAIPSALADTLYVRAKAERWDVSRETFVAALDRSAAKAFGEAVPDARSLLKYFVSLRLDDLALACGCAAGNDAAWDHFMVVYRPTLYRAADALDPSGGARELADSLYADLYGLRPGEESRRSLFAYFHGRSSLATWLRAVLAQRHVDQIRAARRFEPLTEDESQHPAREDQPSDPERFRYLAAIRRAFGRAMARLQPRDRLRLSCYYGQDLTLAQIGRLLGEHEGTVSRHLTRTRRALRDDVAHELQARDGMTRSEVERCFESVIDDPGTLDVRDLLGVTGKELDAERSR
jgi:RNA polymerase sigma-70 factor (ECF subfamily)